MCWDRQGEVLFALHHDGSFVLLYDERSPVFAGIGGKPGLLDALMRFVPEGLRFRVGSITVQEVVRAAKESGRHPWVEEFEASDCSINWTASIRIPACRSASAEALDSACSLAC